MNAIVAQDPPALAPKASSSLASKGRGFRPEQKAAVIIYMLGPDVAKPLLEKLDDDQVAKVLQAFEQISKISREDQAYIVRDFLQGLRDTRGSLRGGPEEGRKMAASLIDEARYQRLFGSDEPGAAPPSQSVEAIWEQVQEKDPEILADYLGRQQAKITALILQKFGPEYAARIVKLLPEEKASAVILKLTDNQPVKPHVLDAIARLLESDILNAKKTAQKTVSYEHLAPVAEVLSLLPSDKQQKMMDFLQGTDADMAEAIKKSMIIVEDIPETMPRNAVPIVFREMDEIFIRKVLKVLQKTHAPVADYLLANISKRMVEQIKEDMDEMEEIEAEAADDLLTEFLTQVMSLHKAEIITLNRTSSS